MIQASSWSEGPAAHQGLEEDGRQRKVRRRRGQRVLQVSSDDDSVA